jgi:hypothetical protein
MLQSIFNTLASSAPQQGNSSQAGGDVLSSVLGSLMGGQTAAPAQPQQTQDVSNELGGLLGSLMGGQGTAAAPAPASPLGSNPLMNLVGSGTNPMLNMLIQPLVDQIAQKLGIPDALAMAAVTFAIHYMLSNHGTKLANNEDMGAVLEKHSAVDHLETKGISAQFAKQANVSPKTAASTLAEVFKLLGSAQP